MSDVEVIKAELRGMRQDVSEIRGAMAKVADALERLARLEERHSTVSGALERLFVAVGKIESRLREIEQSQPVQKLMSGWVANSVWAGAGMAVMLVLKKVGVL